MSKRVVVLGAGTGGTLVANRLRQRLNPAQAQITVVDHDNGHVYQPGLLFVPFGLLGLEEIVRPRHRLLLPGIEFIRSGVDKVIGAHDTVTLTNGTQLGYDALVIASGAHLVPDETSGLTGAGWMERVFTFYSLEGASALEGALSQFTNGRLVVNVAELPIKCPEASIEFCLLADWYFRERQIRHQIDISLLTPDRTFNDHLATPFDLQLARCGVQVHCGFETERVDGGQGAFIARSGQRVDFDLGVVVPQHAGAAYVRRSEGLGDERKFVSRDPRSFVATARDNIFVIGDAGGLPPHCPGTVSALAGDIVATNVEHRLEGLAMQTAAHALESGFVDPGLQALAHSLDARTMAANNPIRKLLYETLYWHVLLAGRTIPSFGYTPEHGQRARPAAHALQRERNRVDRTARNAAPELGSVSRLEREG